MGRKKIHASNAEKQRSYRRKNVDKDVVVALDGEGYDSDLNTHIYASLFAYNGVKLYEIHAMEGLDLARILRFLRDVALENDGALWVTYSFTYDVTQWLKDISADEIKAVLNGGKYLKDYGVFIEYRYRKQLRIVWNKRLRITIYDLFGFTATSFVNALKVFSVVSEIDIIAQGKALRGNKDAYEITRIREYTHAELAACIGLLRAIKHNARNAEIELRRYEGAGSVASGLFRAHNYTGKIAASNSALCAEDEREIVYDRLHRAYYGGRIETLKYGIAKNVVSYDIVSAYPSVIRRLPALRDNRFYYRKSPSYSDILALLQHTDYGVITIKFSLPEEYFYPFPYRDRSSVYFPQLGYTTCYLALFKLAVDVIPHLERYVAIEDVVWLDTAKNQDLPFVWVEDVFLRRKEMKTRGDNAQLMLKLGLNSLYGKFAQRPITVGDKVVNGTYSNIFYAGYITSRTQADLLRVAYQKPETVIAMATDGIFTTEDIHVNLGKNLGQFEREYYEEGVFVYSGFYILRGRDGRLKVRNRGLHLKDADSVMNSVLAHWREGKRSMVYPMRVFRSIKQKKKDSDIVGFFEDIDKQIDLSGGSGKRVSLYTANPGSELCETLAVGYDYFYQSLSDLPRQWAIDVDELEQEE